MKFLFLFFAFPTWVNAQVLLVPDQQISFEKYQEQCKKPGYSCTYTYFLEQIQNLETPLFDSLVNELDYSSEKFCNELPQRILRVLKEEMISLEQVEILQRVIEQTENFVNAQKLKQLQAIEKQLKDNIKFVQSETLTEPSENFLIVFKKPVAIKVDRKLKTDFFKIKTVRVDYNRDLETHEFLVNGECEHEVLHPNVQSLRWQVTREKACSFSEQFSRASSKTSNFFNENKTTLIAVGVVAVWAVLLMNKYDVQVSF